eukprot:scaffold104872_cov34-Tisochrysis_lutea.AAC.2
MAPASPFRSQNHSLSQATATATPLPQPHHVICRYNFGKLLDVEKDVLRVGRGFPCLPSATLPGALRPAPAALPGALRPAPSLSIGGRMPDTCWAKSRAAFAASINCSDIPFQ